MPRCCCHAVTLSPIFSRSYCRHYDRLFRRRYRLPFSLILRYASGYHILWLFTLAAAYATRCLMPPLLPPFFTPIFIAIYHAGIADEFLAAFFFFFFFSSRYDGFQPPPLILMLMPLRAARGAQRVARGWRCQRKALRYMLRALCCAARGRYMPRDAALMSHAALPPPASPSPTPPISSLLLS